MEKNHKHDIAISFAGADRNIALCIYLALKLNLPHSRSYYYPKKQSEMLGKNLKEELQKIYRHESKYVILIVSKDYINKENVFVQTEINAFIPRFIMEQSTYLIPIMIDKTPIEEVHDELEGVTTFQWDYNPEELAKEIQEIIGENESVATTNTKKKNSSKTSTEVNIIGSSFTDFQIGDGNTISK